MTQPANDSASSRHRPVMLSEVLAHLAPTDGDVILDGTFGAGGYTAAVLDAAHCRVVAIDRDPTAIAGGSALVARSQGRLALAAGRFGDLDTIAAEAGAPRLDGIVLDIGVSSMQLDEADRGFSFMADGPLDMRMGAGGASAADLVNGLGEAALADLIYALGEERASRRIARAIVKARAQAPITRTSELARIVSTALGGQRGDDRHPATRTFQALRIAVNDELGELARALAAAERALGPGGRLVVVTFHSLEDRIVKRFLQETAGRLPAGSRHLPPQARSAAPSFQIVNQRPLPPVEEEIRANPRARSAKLRAAVRTAAPPIGPSPDSLGVPVLDLEL